VVWDNKKLSRRCTWGQGGGCRAARAQAGGTGSPS